MTKRISILFGAAIALSGISTANAMEPICWKAALISGAAFKEASSLSYEQRDVTSFESHIGSNMSITRTKLVKLDGIKFEETYLVQEENTSTDDIAIVVIEAYNKANGICVIKSISAPQN
ncbi:MAG: hypothetical protein M9962_13770 [Oligoflexia bacterium]|nr:hypothetical protein [Oligoflexia bacterium]